MTKLFAFSFCDMATFEANLDDRPRDSLIALATPQLSTVADEVSFDQALKATQEQAAKEALEIYGDDDVEVSVKWRAPKRQKDGSFLVWGDTIVVEEGETPQSFAKDVLVVVKPVTGYVN